MTDTRFAKAALFINSLVPLALLGWDAAHRQLGANPLEFVTHTTGMLALGFLLFSLAVTPARKFTGINEFIKFRRMLGLFAFFYGCLHLITYIWFDRAFNLASTVQDIARRPFILVGMATLAAMVPLAVTSTRGMIKRLGGKRWNRLHRLAYAAGAGGVLHYWLLVKSDTRLPFLFFCVLGLLLGYRLFQRMTKPPVRREGSEFV